MLQVEEEDDGDKEEVEENFDDDDDNVASLQFDFFKIMLRKWLLAIL